MNIIYDTLKKLVNKIKKLLILLVSIAVLLALALPYGVGIYIEKEYRTITKNITSLNPGIIITNNVQRNYLNSKIITKIQVSKNIFFDNQSSIIEHDLPTDNLINKIFIVLQHDVKHVPFNKILHKNRLIAEIQTKVLAGFPGFLHQEQPVFSLTTIDFKRHLKTVVNEINMEYVLDLAEDHSLQAKQIAIQLENDNKNFKANLEIPKLIYIENSKKAEIDDVQLNININNFKSANKLNVNILTEIDRVYIVEKLKPILRLVNFSMEQNLKNVSVDNSTLSNSISFVRLNVHEQKFGPLATKWQIRNIHLPTIINSFNDVKLPITIDQISRYKLAEIGNSLLKYQPNLSIDLLLNTSSGKLKLLSDFTANPKDVDWFTKEDILDSLQANIAAHIPRKVFFELVTVLLQEKLKKETSIQPVYKSHNKHTNNLPKALALQDPKEFHRQLEDMVIERVNYLLKNHIIKQQNNSFVLDLSIAEGTFYSRMNPFKLFSF